ncbi:hypothetical protein ACOMHN_014982 [Nucella lapillus]
MDSTGQDENILIQGQDWGADLTCEQIRVHETSTEGVASSSTMVMRRKTNIHVDFCLRVQRRPGLHELTTYFRKSIRVTNCATTFDGVYQFAYERSLGGGGGGICDNTDSEINACQEFGSPYVDNELFRMKYARCPEIQTSFTKNFRFVCLGSWTVAMGTVTNYTFAAIADVTQREGRERFKCLLTEPDLGPIGNASRWVMSRFATCKTLRSVWYGPVRLALKKTANCSSSDGETIHTNDRITQTTPSTDQTTPSTDQTTPSDKQTTPSTDQTTPSGNQTTPNSNQTTPSGNQTTPNTDQTTDGKTVKSSAPSLQSLVAIIDYVVWIWIWIITSQ